MDGPMETRSENRDDVIYCVDSVNIFYGGIRAWTQVFVHGNKRGSSHIWCRCPLGVCAAERIYGKRDQKVHEVPEEREIT